MALEDSRTAWYRLPDSPSLMYITFLLSLSFLQLFWKLDTFRILSVSESIKILNTVKDLSPSHQNSRWHLIFSLVHILCSAWWQKIPGWRRVPGLLNRSLCSTYYSVQCLSNRVGTSNFVRLVSEKASHWMVARNKEVRLLTRPWIPNWCTKNVHATLHKKCSKIYQQQIAQSKSTSFHYQVSIISDRLVLSRWKIFFE